MSKKEIDENTREWLREIGKKGGSKQTKAQAEAFKKHLLGKGGAPKGNENWKGRLKKG